MPGYPQILHHGARSGVTGSCHELRLVHGYLEAKTELKG